MVDKAVKVRPKYLTKAATANLDYSIVTLVASQRKYDTLLASFSARGFTGKNSEYFAIDNRGSNGFDGYSFLRAASPALRGRFVILTHDDVELVDDGADDLGRILEDLEERDPNWVIAGNGGAVRGTDDLALHIIDPHGTFDIGEKPILVDSLDENFLVMPRSRLVYPSLDLDGFHLFATDLCLQARAKGGRAYVIPFKLRHHSGGEKSAAYWRAAKNFERKWTELGVQGVIRTPSARLYFGPKGRVLRLKRELSVMLRRIYLAVRKRLPFVN